MKDTSQLPVSLPGKQNGMKLGKGGWYMRKEIKDAAYKGHSHDTTITIKQEIRRNKFINDEVKCSHNLPPNFLAARTKNEV